MANQSQVQNEEAMSNVKYIKRYFEAGFHGRKVELSELKALSKADREELGPLCAEALEKGWD